MPFVWPTLEQALYRAMRLRRLIGVAVFIPMIVLLVLSTMDPVILSAQHASIAAVLIAVLVVGHAVLFPNVTLETIALSLSATLLVVAMPSIKAVSLWAPAEHATGALVILMSFAVALAGVFMALLQIVLNAIVYVGPAVSLTLKTSIDLTCSASVARQQFALQPQSRRGRVLTGAADENGFFDVAVATAPTEIDPATGEDALVRLDAKVMHSCADRHDVMLLLRNGSVTVTSQAYVPTVAGTRLEVSDLPGDFTLGMHGLFWLTDQQADNLTETADIVAGQDARANGVAHNVSLLSVAGAVLSPRTPTPPTLD